MWLSYRCSKQLLRASDTPPQGHDCRLKHCLPQDAYTPAFPIWLRDCALSLSCAVAGPFFLEESLVGGGFPLPIVDFAFLSSDITEHPFALAGQAGRREELATVRILADLRI